MRRARTVALVVTLSLVAGCQAAPRRAPNRATVSPVEEARVEVLNVALDERCRIQAGQALYEGDILVGAVRVRSLLDAHQALQYRWTWFDVDGFQQEVPEDRWRALVVRAFEERQVEGRAPLPKAVRGVFELRFLPRS